MAVRQTWVKMQDHSKNKTGAQDQPSVDRRSYLSERNGSRKAFNGTEKHQIAGYFTAKR